MYLPCFVFPYQRVPCLRKTPDSVLTHTIPALFVCDACCFAAPEVAGVVEAGVVEVEEVEGEEAEVGFAVLGAAAGVAAAGGLSALLDCGDCARTMEPLAKSTDATSAEATSAEATSRARDSFFALGFIALLLMDLRVHWNAG